RIRPDEGPLPDRRAMLVEAVVVAGDRTRTDVGARAHVRIADIGEVIDLRACRDHRVLDLDEIADVCLFTNHSAGTQPRKRPDNGTRGNPRPLDVAVGANDDPVTNDDAGREEDVRLDGDVTPED